MSNELFQQYGYCEIPKGTILYRMGEIFEERGATFALHPNWAMNFTEGSNRLIFDYEVMEKIKVLFLVTNLRRNGLPKSAIEELYEAKIGAVNFLDDLDIKNRDVEASSKFKKMISSLNVIGWLTTMEGNQPLEVFLLKEGLKSIKKIGNLIERDDYPKYENSLRNINVQPSQLFITKSNENLQEYFNNLVEYSKRQSESHYGLFDKLFV